MDLSQRKLIKEEWEGLEKPLSEEEIKILNMIKDGFNNVDIVDNDVKSIMSWMKVTIIITRLHKRKLRKKILVTRK